MKNRSNVEEFEYIQLETKVSENFLGEKILLL